MNLDRQPIANELDTARGAFLRALSRYLSDTSIASATKRGEVDATLNTIQQLAEITCA